MVSYQRKFYDKIAASQWLVHPSKIFRSAGGESNAVLLRPKKAIRALVVLVHATGNDAIYPSGDLIIELLKENFAVFTFDLDGHGQNSNTRLSTKNIFSNITEAIDTAVETLKTNNITANIPIHLCGFSFGGALSLATEDRQKQRIRTRIAVGVPTHVHIQWQSSLRELSFAFSKDFWNASQSWGAVQMLPAVGRFKRQLYPIRIESNGGHSVGQLWYVSTVNTILDLAMKMRPTAAYSSPTLVISGKGDPIAPPEHGHRWCQFAENAVELVTPCSSHFGLFLSPLVRQHVMQWLLMHS